MTEDLPGLALAGKFDHLPLALRPRQVRWALIALLVLGFEAFVQLGFVKRTVAAPPSALVTAIVAAFASGEAVEATARTLTEIALGFAAALLAGVPLGVLLWRWRFVRDVLQPALIVLYAVPLIFFYPLLLAALGIGLGPIVAVAFAGGTVPVALNVMVGLLEIQPIWQKTALAYRATSRQMFAKVYLPGAAPYIFSGIRLGLTYVTIGVIAMEFITSDGGLGYLARYYKDFFSTAQTYGYITLVFIFAMTSDYLLRKLERASRRGAS